MHFLNKLHIGSANNFIAYLAIAVALPLASGTLQAGEYYVSPTGSAQWNQCININTPCSPATAMKYATAGDTTYFRGGTYTVSGTPPSYQALLEPANSGTQSSPIIFKAYESEAPLISVNCTASWNQCMVIGTNAKDYITWDGFILTASNNKTAGAFIGGQSYSTGAVFKNNTIIAGTLPVPNSDNADITRMEKTSNAIYRNNLIRGLQSTNRSASTDNNACLKMYHNDHALIENNEFDDCPAGISAKSDLDYSIIRNNYFHDCYENFRLNVFLNQFSTGNEIYNNVFVNSGKMHISVQSEESALADDWKVYNNTFYSDGTFAHGGLIVFGHSPNLDFYNNISVVTRGEYFNTTRNLSTLSSIDHNQWGNIVFRIKLRQYEDSVIYNSLSQWLTSGELIGGGNPGAGSLASDPLFLNSSGTMTKLSDFELSPSSPSKGAGRSGADMGANVKLVGPSLISPPKPPTITDN